MAHLQSLNEAQRHAVTTEANVVQVLAPPGSGKTKTLTSRVAHLLRDRNYKPWNVICLTFTIKSSREMGERLCRLIGESVGKKVILGTFHSICRRYLATYGHLIGLEKGFGIIDASDALAVVKRIVKRLDLGTDPKKARDRISNCKSKGIGPDDLAKQAARKNNKKQNSLPDSTDKQEIVIVFQEYEAYLKRSNLLDFDDLLLRCVELLKHHPTCVKNVQAVLIDEFQDTNHAQFDLMRLFAQHCQCVTTVGDPDQSIYGWRNAEVTNLSKMQELWPETRIVNLEQNYRSAGAILTAAQALIEQDTVRPQKALVPTHREGTKPVLRLLPNPEIESEWIVSEIKRFMILSAGLLDYSDIAVLLRSSPLSRQIEGAFGKAGIPYRMVGGTKFFDRVEVKLLLDYLRVVVQPSNSDALSRIVNVPSRGIGDVTIKGLLEEAMAQGRPLWEMIQKSVKGTRKTKTRLTTKQAAGLASLHDLVVRARQRLEDESNFASPTDLLKLILKKLDFKDWLAKDYKQDHETRWENVEQLLTQASDPSYSLDSEAIRDDALPDVDGITQVPQSKTLDSLTKFLANVAIASEVQSKEETDAEGKPKSTVTISTMHAAKGLEWPIVFIPACYEGSIPHSRAADTDEERRLLYVAMTRAQAVLSMSIPVRDFSGDKRDCSSFLERGEVKGTLIQAAPLLEYCVIEDIARVLSRPVPHRDDLTRAIKNCDNILDDRWPTNGEFDPEDNAKQWVGMSNSYGYRTAQEGFKRRKVSGENTGFGGETKTSIFAKTTMEMSRSSAALPTVSAGFTTASKQMEIQQKLEEWESSKKPAVSAKPTMDAEEKEPLARSTKRSAGQSSLMGWFGAGAAKDLTASTAAAVRGEVQAPTHITESPRQPSRQPMHPMAPNTSNRPSRSSGQLKASRKPLSTFVPSQKAEVTKEYIFLSSSPPPEACLSPKKNRSAGEERQIGKTDPSTFQPASTMHVTSVGRLKSNNSRQVPKRRLGMGGPMKPWRP